MPPNTIQFISEEEKMIFLVTDDKMVTYLLTWQKLFLTAA